MITIAVMSREGQNHIVESPTNVTLMEAIRSAGLDELIALCGGCCSCATCHVYVDDAYSDRLAPMSADESDLLDSSEHRTAHSRLSCQVPLHEGLDGLTVNIAPED
jgi:2Fe-2S ferredoxin